MLIAIISALITWNLVVFVLYGIDKRKAVKEQWRISEKTLLLTSFCFGGIGALLGGKVFRHKTQKWYFQMIWYLGIAMIIAGFYLLYMYYYKK